MLGITRTTENDPLVVCTITTQTRAATNAGCWGSGRRNNHWAGLRVHQGVRLRPCRQLSLFCRVGSTHRSFATADFSCRQYESLSPYPIYSCPTCHVFCTRAFVLLLSSRALSRCRAEGAFRCRAEGAFKHNVVITSTQQHCWTTNGLNVREKQLPRATSRTYGLHVLQRPAHPQVAEGSINFEV